MWELVRANQRRSRLIVIGMALLLAAMGYLLGDSFLEGQGGAGLAIALAVWGVLWLITVSAGDSMLLSIARARPIEKRHHPVLYNVVEEMTIAAGLPAMPSVYIIDDPAPNAFATGRDPRRAAVAVTSGLLERLDRDELQGVIAHELAHIKNRDVLYMTTLIVMVGTIGILASMGRRLFLFRGGGRRRTSSAGGGQAALLLAAIALLLMILAPLIARLLYFASSRRREYVADGCAALFTRYPAGLASALEKISLSPRRLAAANEVTAPLYIVNPLSVTRAGLADLTSTHPPLSRRIKILRSMAGQAGLTNYDEAYRKVTGRAVGVVPRSHQDGRVAEARAAAPEAGDPRARVRGATDALWRLQNFAFIPCVCGTTLKVPPEFRGPALRCPHCGREHEMAT
ncbi:MAG: M48 family metallopeptidase [Candidatus Eisenbacteria bacterium]|uniref:Protease HtpX homolog n=1 Tax=Eiseniibacteriota bacterium TaxID=2212470 RepID=A0A937XDW1_UNCEI|nr:M48 family metallopeptidase [Candidatus Eisenbacteria bacterium]